MLENLANSFTMEQLRNIKYNKIFHQSLWKNSNFWYYVVLRHRPDLIDGPFNINMPYKRIAMKNIVAPGETIKQVGEMDTRLQHMLKVVMNNHEALDTLLHNLTLDEIQAWNRVSVDFRRIVAESNVFWFKMWQEYGDAPEDEVYIFTQNYRQIMQMEQPNLFNVVLSIDTYNSPDVELELVGPAADEFKSMDFRLIDIWKYGGPKPFLQYIDSYSDFINQQDMTSYTYKPYEILHITFGLDSDYGYDVQTLDDAPSLWSILNKEGQNDILMREMQDGQTFVIVYSCELTEADRVEVTLIYPEELQAYYYSDSKRKWIEDAFQPRIMQASEVRKTQSFYTFRDYPDKGDDLEYVDIELPAYFTLRGDIGRPVDIQQWGEIFVNDEIVPFERLEEKSRAALMERKDVLIEFRKF